MNVRKIAGLALVALGLVVLVMRGFEYTKKHKKSVGPFDFSVKERKQVPIPAWAGVVAVVAGVACLVMPGRRQA